MFHHSSKYIKQIFCVKIFIITLMVTIISGCSALHATLKEQAQESQGACCLTIEEVENKLVRGGYLQNLHAANWAVTQDSKIIPILEVMLGKKEQYQTQGTGAAFPFNAVWALAHMKDPEALAVLERYYTKSQDDSARLAIAGHKLRSEAGADCGVLLLDSCSLYSEPSGQGLVLQTITKGQSVKVLKSRIENPKEIGGRGGVQLYDYIELISSGTQGYIPRTGDDFSPLM